MVYFIPAGISNIVFKKVHNLQLFIKREIVNFFNYFRKCIRGIHAKGLLTKLIKMPTKNSLVIAVGILITEFNSIRKRSNPNETCSKDCFASIISYLPL